MFTCLIANKDVVSEACHAVITPYVPADQASSQSYCGTTSVPKANAPCPTAPEEVLKPSPRDGDFDVLLGQVRWSIMFALIRIVYICLAASCCSGAFAHTNQIRASIATSFPAIDPANFHHRPHRLLSQFCRTKHCPRPSHLPYRQRVSRLERCQRSGANFSHVFLLTRRCSQPAAQMDVLARRLDFAFYQLLNLLENTRGAPAGLAQSCDQHEHQAC